METQDTKRALTILRNDLSGLNFDSDRLHFLSRSVFRAPCLSPRVKIGMLIITHAFAQSRHVL